ncbi:MAG TPA: amidohydrolase [Actinomycetes bacterium]|nr:amidohydrolase [Actinomycetes bacterium]
MIWPHFSMESTAGQQLILHSGRVFTATDEEPWVDAVAIDGDRIAATGATEDLIDRFPGSTLISLDGRTVVPGFIDAHNHFLATGESLASVDVRYEVARSIDDVVRLLHEAAANTPAGTWITAFGLDDAKYDRKITRADLDLASESHPIRVLHISGHHVLVNSAGLAERGVTEESSDPPGGSLGRDASGRLDGWALDAAMSLIVPTVVDIGSHGPNFHTELALDDAVDLVERAGRAFLAAGLTTVCDAQVTSRELTAYREARRLDRLPVRTVCMPLSHQLHAFADIGMAGPFGDDRLRIGAMKFYADGSLIGGTAMFSEPYGESGEFEGSMYHSPEDLTALIGDAHANGWQVGVHVQGDRAIGYVLDAVEAAVAASPREHRHRLEHAGYPTPEQLGRIAALGAYLVVQPSYLYDSGDQFLVRLGNRAHRLQPLKDALDAGIPVVLSSDSDVCSYRPLDTIRAAMTRRTRDGASIGGDQALTIEQALRAHTIVAARALWMNDAIGSLEPGKLADIAVIDGDITTGTAESTSALNVSMTMVGGEIAHQA